MFIVHTAFFEGKLENYMVHVELVKYPYLSYKPAVTLNLSIVIVITNKMSLFQKVIEEGLVIWLTVWVVRKESRVC